MEDALTMISRLKRPTLLVRTARHGLADYKRVIHLRRLLKTEAVPGPSQAIIKLMDLEVELDLQRQNKRAEYSAARHVEALVALMSEARILKASQASKIARESRELLDH
ncbi:hypothetical protein SAMN05444287_1070 [Octadecabacter temperatus]|uniref:Uncharacterized protein n=1 Tax=Octadecabacter temperatus TaxID=1458307 RepID=A0A0K0Y4V3_9RHOB|nr:DUF6477 family protein [Octadecabacter temperatus]AKS45965.1 hypothetical protein OSB_14130 [Octadecabacter temperatus]SIO04565.1 hypothetical protein SAMN05444287_1070 [Octadecabacter temperatus]